MDDVTVPAPLPSTSDTSAAPCRLCGASAPAITRRLLLNRHLATYFRCPGCDLIQTEQPYWLEEAYKSAICASDTGAVARNVLSVRLTSAVAKVLGLGPQSRYLDFGGGHGVFVRMMRDRGWPFRWYDSHAANLYAAGFGADPSEPSDFVTAFEVLEHLVEVSGDMARLFAPRPSALLVSTMLHSGHEDGWWYYSPHTGQHVAFYSSQTMQWIARRFGYRAAGSRAYTLFVRNDAPYPRWRIQLAQKLVRISKGNSTHPLVASLDGIIPDFPSLTVPDSQAAQAA